MPGSRYTLDMSLQNLLDTSEITGGDILEIRHIIKGGSIMEWPRLHFRSLPAVNEFLRVSQYDPENILHMERLSDIHQSAVSYIQTVLSIAVPTVLQHPNRLQNLFLYASSDGEHRARACMILKVMHVINHLEARELLYHLPVSEREFFSRVESRVSSTVNRMLELGFPIETYQASQKTKESLITKLLSKRKDTAAQVFDRIRFRIISSHRKGLLPILMYLKRHLTPFPYAIPGESTNTIAPISTLFKEMTGSPLRHTDRDFGPHTTHNPFSHKDFRVISFVVDIPIRVDDLADPASRRLLTKFGHIVFVPTEFQTFDKATYFLNESGPAAHDHYKERQITEVINRLYMGDDEESRPEPKPEGRGEALRKRPEKHPHRRKGDRKHRQGE